MIGGLVNISMNGRHLSVHRGFLKISEDRTEIARVPLDDIDALILSARQITLTRSLISALTDRGSIIVSCGVNYHPESLTWPLDANHQAAGILHDQTSASLPLTKRLWQKIVQAKIRNQMAALDRITPGHTRLSDMRAALKAVKSGDPDNREAVAARASKFHQSGGVFKLKSSGPRRHAKRAQPAPSHTSLPFRMGYYGHHGSVSSVMGRLDRPIHFATRAQRLIRNTPTEQKSRLQTNCFKQRISG